MSSTVARTIVAGRAEPPRSEARDSLRDEKDLVRVRVAHFGAGREAAHVYIALVGCIWTGDETGLVRHRDAIRNVALGGLDRCSRRRRFRRRDLGAGIIRRRRRLHALLKRLLDRRVLILRSGLISGVPAWGRWLRFRTGVDKESRKEREQDRLFHKSVASDDVSRFVIHSVVSDKEYLQRMLGPIRFPTINANARTLLFE